jgi:hypothetical protein
MDVFSENSEISMTAVDEQNEHGSVVDNCVRDPQATSIVRYIGDETTLTISSCIELLCESCFESCTSLVSVMFESGSRLLRIDSWAFRNCGSLKSIVIPESVEIICEGSFQNCSSLARVEFETASRLIQIGDDAFALCPELKLISLPGSVETMSGLAFSCTAITFARRSSSFRISLGKLLSASGVCLVRFFANEKTVTIGSDLDVLGKGCFRYCDSIRSVVFKPRSKRILIEAEAFSSCQQLQSIVIPSRVKSIPRRCFSDCPQLTSVQFESPSILVTIEEEAFRGCITLVAICIPRSVEVLCPLCFFGCRALWNVTFESQSKLARIEKEAFDKCKFSLYSLIKIPFSVKHCDTRLLELIQLAVYTRGMTDWT